MKHLLGIDIGAAGCIAVLDMHLSLVELIDMPTLALPRTRKGGKTGATHVVDGATLAARLAPYAGPDTVAAVESESSRPGNGAASMFAFGASDGAVRAVLACLGIGARSITPAAWKHAHGIPTGADKHFSRARAIRLYPSHAASFGLAKHDGRAEAVLIALAVAQEIPALALDLGTVQPGVIARHLRAAVGQVQHAEPVTSAC